MLGWSSQYVISEDLVHTSEFFGQDTGALQQDAITLVWYVLLWLTCDYDKGQMYH
jgi:hypothetical protein